MKKIFRNLFSALCLVILPDILVYSEGTKQIMPSANTKGQLCINKYRNDFAFYDAAPEFRLNISIADPSEVIRFGFGKILDENAIQSNLFFRIKGPSGNIISPESPVPTSGAGFISSYAAAVAGPLPGGYPYLEFKPTLPGDYYIEFYYPGANADIRRYIEYFDITVVNASGSAVDGRVWSKAWHFWSAADNYSATERFYGKMMILSDDSIVTQVDCNGFRGGRFSISSNITGCYQTGTLSTDRMSRTGFHTYPQYKIFLNDPDNKLFPTQKLLSGIIAPVTITTDCKTGGAVFGIKVDRDCVIRLSIKLNSSGGNSDEVSIIESVTADPGGNGYNLIPWNGNDNSGKQVANGTSLTYTVTNLNGITHLPMYDIENNDYGFIVNQIRPAGGQLKIYWDDSSVGGTTNSSAGCNSSNGCHSWGEAVGNNNTINTWWFVSGSETSAVPFVTERKPGPVLITGSNVHCVGPGSLEFSVTNEQNSTGFIWSYSGVGVTIDASELIATLDFSANAKADTLKVHGWNNTCFEGPSTSIPIIFEALPKVTLASYPDICYTAPGLQLTGGKPEGGVYFVDGAKADSLFPYRLPEGFYSISYSYASPTGCLNSDTASVHLFNSPDCEGTIFFPGAFSPNSDTRNDYFRPVVENIFSFTMHIYNRWGECMYTTRDVAKGWDGNNKGVQCPSGAYSYEATYAPSLRTGEYKTKRGMLTLIR